MRLFLDILQQTLRVLWAHKLRSFLTMFGIAWGVGSLLLLIGLGEGFRSGQAKNLAQMGSDVMFLWPGRIPAVEGSKTSGRYYRLTYRDYQVVKEQATRIRAVSPVLSRGDIRASSEFNGAAGQVAGVAPNYNQIRNLPIDVGRWMSTQDEADERRVAVIGYDLFKTLFAGRPGVGSEMLLNGNRFEVIGILQRNNRGGSMSGTDMRVFIPISVMRSLFPMKGNNVEDAISYLNYQPLRTELHNEAKQEVHNIIGRLHGFNPKMEDSFEDWDTIEEARRVGLIFNAMDMFLGAVGVVTLALGAIGIVNIMLVSVAERTKEIGLRKAIGATNRNVLLQFFLEGAFLTGFSGLMGLAGAGTLMFLLSLLPPMRGFDTPRIVPESAALAIGALCVAGIFAGLYPARKAAMLQPVVALRSE